MLIVFKNSYYLFIFELKLLQPFWRKILVNFLHRDAFSPNILRSLFTLLKYSWFNFHENWIQISYRKTLSVPAVRLGAHGRSQSQLNLRSSGHVIVHEHSLIKCTIMARLKFGRSTNHPFGSGNNETSTSLLNTSSLSYLESLHFLHLVNGVGWSILEIGNEKLCRTTLVNRISVDRYGLTISSIGFLCLSNFNLQTFCSAVCCIFNSCNFLKARSFWVMIWWLF